MVKELALDITVVVGLEPVTLGSISQYPKGYR